MPFVVSLPSCFRLTLASNHPQLRVYLRRGSLGITCASSE